MMNETFENLNNWIGSVQMEINMTVEDDADAESLSQKAAALMLDITQARSGLAPETRQLQMRHALALFRRHRNLKKEGRL